MEWKKGIVADMLDEILQPISQDIQGNLVFGSGGLVDNAINSLIIDKLPIKMTGGKDAPIIHMYIQMGITSLVDWIHVKSAVEATQYKLSYNGEGVYISGYGCGICRGINHPGGLCPTVDIPNNIPLAENAVP